MCYKKEVVKKEKALSVNGVSKIYRVYQRPVDRLLQFLWRSRKQLFKEFQALDNINFEVERGETLAIVGANGSGKSTLLQIIAGTIEPSAGELQANGRVAALLELGAGFNPEFTGIENIELSGRLYGLSEGEMAERIDSIIEFSGIGNFVHQEVKTYSSGMYVRLAFSVVAHLDPDILIVDEALSVGDFIFQQKCARYMRETLAGVTKLLVTHDLGAVSAMADRVLVLSHGRQVFIGDTQTGLAVYQKVARAALEGTKVGADELVTTAVDRDEQIEGWLDIDKSRLSGTGRVRIRRFNWFVAGKEQATTINESELLTLHLDLELSNAVPEPVVGYQVQDRLGTAIFGENSVSSSLDIESMAAGVYRLSLKLLWPQVAPSEYGITLGVGDGLIADSHVVQCWAHNIITLTSLKTQPAHGIFNNKMTALDVQFIG